MAYSKAKINSLPYDQLESMIETKIKNIKRNSKGRYEDDLYVQGRIKSLRHYKNAFYREKLKATPDFTKLTSALESYENAQRQFLLDAKVGYRYIMKSFKDVENDLEKFVGTLSADKKSYFIDQAFNKFGDYEHFVTAIRNFDILSAETDFEYEYASESFDEGFKEWTKGSIELDDFLNFLRERTSYNANRDRNRREFAEIWANMTDEERYAWHNKTEDKQTLWKQVKERL